jgi:hypothetical protein
MSFRHLDVSFPFICIYPSECHSGIRMSFRHPNVKFCNLQTYHSFRDGRTLLFRHPDMSFCFQDKSFRDRSTISSDIRMCHSILSGYVLLISRYVISAAGCHSILSGYVLPISALCDQNKSIHTVHCTYICMHVHLGVVAVGGDRHFAGDGVLVRGQHLAEILRHSKHKKRIE